MEPDLIAEKSGKVLARVRISAPRKSGNMPETCGNAITFPGPGKGEKRPPYEGALFLFRLSLPPFPSVHGDPT